MILSSKPKLKYNHTQPAQILRQVESNTLSAKKTHHCVIRVERIWTAAHNAQHPISPHTPPSHPSQEACFYSMSCKWVWPFPQPPTSRSLSLCFFLPLPLSLSIRLGSLTALLSIWPPLFRDPDTKWPSVRPHTHTHDWEDMGNEGERVINSTKEKLNSS